MIQIDTLLCTYKDRLFENIVSRKIDDNITELPLLFLDRHNDCIQVYLRDTGNGTFLITDAGHIVNDPDTCGYTITDWR